MRDASGAGGNITWTFHNETLDDADVIVEDTETERQVTTNFREVTLSFTELFEAPGLELIGTSLLKFRILATHNAGGDRTLDIVGCEVAFNEVDRVVAP
jgi:hypothetical protein